MFRLILILVFLAAPAMAGTRIIDGDTIELDGVTYRLNGIDAPEQGQRCGNWRCGVAATEKLAALVAGKAVRCDASGTDGYGRTIATCFAGNVDLGKAMIEAGVAWAFHRYSDVYAQDEQTAKARGLGIWSGTYTAPWDFRAEMWTDAAQKAPEGCPIKGNISDNGHIYHAPWSPWYSRTRINTARGERWFCSEAEAIEEGWRAPHWK